MKDEFLTFFLRSGLTLISFVLVCSKVSYFSNYFNYFFFAVSGCSSSSVFEKLWNEGGFYSGTFHLVCNYWSFFRESSVILSVQILFGNNVLFGALYV